MEIRKEQVAGLRIIVRAAYYNGWHDGVRDAYDMARGDYVDGVHDHAREGSDEYEAMVLELLGTGQA